jgi:3-hydroxyacyl-CoA dehydrogenase/1,4-dihydroxy-2-naphthoyl-CoA synthase
VSRFRIETMPAGVPGPAGAGEIVHLVMDDPARAANVLDGPALADLETALAELEGRPGLGGVVVRSGKRGSFVAGADVEMLGPATDRAAVRAAIGRAQQVLTRLAALPCPTVAAIDGACLGSGAELALACSSRVAADEPHTRIGLPEILLGGIPAFGGTARLPRLVGTAAALDLLLTGRLLDARQAERVGLVARAVPGAWLIEHAHRRLAELTTRAAGRRGTRALRGSAAWVEGGAGSSRDHWRPRGLRAWFADGTAAGRALAFSRASARIRALTRGDYPAPVAALGVLRHGATLPMEAALQLEAEWAADLAVGPVCRNLVRVFRIAETARGAGADAGATTVERLQVVGAGVMGTGLAELASRNGIEVRLRDSDPAALARALRSLRARIAERVARSQLAPHEAEAQLARIRPGLEPAGLRLADLAIEMVFDDLDVKRRVFGELEVRMQPDAVLATATASLAVDELAAGLGHPERFVGLHFLHPIARWQLVEVVRGTKTSAEALATALALVRRLGRIPVVVKDAPGFAVNRVVMSGLREALHLLEDGYRVADVDAALRGFGMAMGPFEAMDQMGLDVVARLLTVLGGAFPERFAPTPQLEALTVTGRLGRGSGAGFYRYRQGRRAPDPQAVRLIGAVPRRRPAHLGALAERVTLAMANEAAGCLADGVVPDAGALDLASIHGAGFPLFRGGILRHADTLGLARVEARLSALRAENGERFRPAPLIARLAAAGDTFAGPDAG